MPDARKMARAAMLGMAAVLVAAAGTADAADRYWPPIVDPPTGQHTPGRWVWGDLVTSDVAAAADFYGKVFGWTFETYGGEDDRDTYTLALADGLPIGGLVFDQRAMKDDAPSARWIGLISVTDVRAAADAVTKGGGKVVVTPTMLGERGETAVFQDPEGTLFGIVRSKNGDPADYVGDLNEWVWIDLWTADVDQATKFYSAVAGYSGAAARTAGPAQRRAPRFRQLRPGGHHAEARQARTSAVWLPYLRVADAKPPPTRRVPQAARCSASL
jgi:uncharacterized protein